MSNQEQKHKPVWRVNTGNGVPSDLHACLIDKSGIKYFAYGEFRDDDDLWSLEADLFGSDIAAYETTRTKAAKYEVVDCEECLGGYEGVFDPSASMGYMQSTNKCKHCNGKGYALERIK